VIVDNVIRYSDTTETLFEYFEAVLEFLEFYCVTIKLDKTKWLEPQLLFVGRDIPALAKFAAFKTLPEPKTWSELRMIIGIFGFYQAWIERYELRIAPYRRIHARQPMPGQLARHEEEEYFAGFWLPEHRDLFEQLKSEILSKPALVRPDPNRRFYVKTHWCCDGMAVALLQAATQATDPTLRWLADDFPLAQCLIVGPLDFYQKAPRPSRYKTTSYL
jgi:hypothetical protein